METVYAVAGIDVHKVMLAVVLGVVESQEIRWKRQRFGTTNNEIRRLSEWLAEQQVSEVAMESTAQYWRPVWIALEGQFQLHLAQARSTTGPRGRKSDFADATRIVKRLLSSDLTLSYVPDAEQRRWRLLTRGRQQLIRDRVRLQSQLEGLLEEAQIKLSSVISNLLGSSGRRILQALAAGKPIPSG
jgi:transposase